MSGPDQAVLYAYEHVGFNITPDGSAVLYAYENVIPPSLQRPTIGRVVARQTVDPLVLYAYENVT